MLGPYGYAIWLLCTLLEAAVVVCAIKKNALQRYLLLNVNMAASVLVSIARYNILSHCGFTSKEYLYFYYYSDSVLTITLSLRGRALSKSLLCRPGSHLCALGCCSKNA